MPELSLHPEAIASNALWYLGIDFGTTGVCAALLNYSTSQRYPIYWSHKLSTKIDELPTTTSDLTPRNSDSSIWRLPTVAYFEEPLSLPIAVGSWASASANADSGLLLKNFKPYLNQGIPYYCPKRHEWEPTLELPSQQLVPLYLVRQALQALLSTLGLNNTPPNTRIKVGAKGLEKGTLTTALQTLQGVILGCPVDSSDTYRFNLREAVLEAKLVSSPEQIFFLEDAIACLLAALPSSGKWVEGENSLTQTQDDQQTFTPAVAPPSTTPPESRPQAVRPLALQRGGTLVINSGATTTELTLVNLPDNLQDLTYSSFSLCSLPNAGNALDQDIFCQLLYPQLSVEQQQQLSLSDQEELPQPGKLDLQRRDRLTLLLQRSALGQALLKAARSLKIILQHKQQFTLDLGKQQCTLTHIDLEDKVVEPFVQLLNQALNALLIDSGISEPGIYQVFLLGGTASLSRLAQWIQKRLPNAAIVRDTDSPDGSWVANGLATLPMYPQVLNRLRQQYSDYFLLLELLRAFPETTGAAVTPAYSIEEIMQQLERRGLNTSACYEQLVRLVEGYLPEGLVPSTDETSLLSPSSKQNLLYSNLAGSMGPFSREGERLYRRNPQQQEYLQQYLDLVLSGSQQKFEEPLVVTWV